MKPTNPIRDHIFTVPSLLTQQVQPMYQQICALFNNRAQADISHILLTGCGYSHAAAMVSKYYFESLAGISTTAAPTMEISRFTDIPLLPHGHRTMLIGVSSSGVVARVAEAVKRFGLAGATTVAFTSDPHSVVAAEANIIVNINVPPMPSSLPLRSYAMTVLTFLLLAIRLGELRGRLSQQQREKLLADISLAAQQLNLALPAMDEAVKAFASKTNSVLGHEFIGAGPDYGSAWLGRQQIMGQAGCIATHIDPEDWLHGNFFMAHPDKIATMLLVDSRSPGRSRSLEALKYMVHLNRLTAVVTDDETLVVQGGHLILVPKLPSSMLTPFAQMMVVSLYASYSCAQRGEQYSRGFRDKWAFSRDGAATEHSELVLIP